MLKKTTHTILNSIAGLKLRRAGNSAYWCRNVVAVLAVAVTLGLTSCSSSSSPSGGNSSGTTGKHYTIAIALLAPVGVLETNIARFKSGLAQQGFVSGKNVTYDEVDAQGNLQNVNLIVKQLADKNPDLIYAVGTPFVLGFKQQAVANLPVLFGAMTDPTADNVVASLQHPGGEFTGTSDAVAPSSIVKVVKEVVPNAKRIGFIGNISEQNTATQINQLKAAASAAGYSVTVAPVAATGQIQLAIQSLKGKVDAVVVGADNTVISAIATAGNVALPSGLPFIAAGGPTDAAGVLVSFGADYGDLGASAAKQAGEILHGRSPAGIPVIDPASSGGYSVTVNTKTAAALHITLPAKVLGLTPTKVGG